MPIIYTYPPIDPVVADLLVLSDASNSFNTASSTITDVLELSTGILDLNQFNFFGDTINISTPPANGDTLIYNNLTNQWIIGSPGTIQDEVIPVVATDSGSSVYTGVGTPTQTSYDQDKIYLTTFNTTNTHSPATLDIDGIGAYSIQRGTLNGFEDIPINYIAGATNYYLTWDGTRFQIFTTNPSSGSTVEFINPTPVTETIGGITVGTTFPIKASGDGYSLQEMFDMLLYPYQAPVLSSLSITGVSSTLEVGDTISSGAYPFNWSKTNSGNIDATSGVISDITNVVTLLSSIDIKTLSTISVTLPTNIQKTTGSATHKWKITGLNTQGGSISPSIFTATWLWKRYVGNSTNIVLTESQIEALSVNSSLSSSLSGSYVFPGGGYKYLCIPTSFPEPSSITSGGFPVAMADGSTTSSAAYVDTGTGPYKFDTISVTNTYAQTINYRVYRSLNQLNGSSTFIVS